MKDNNEEEIKKETSENLNNSENPINNDGNKKNIDLNYIFDGEKWEKDRSANYNEIINSPKVNRYYKNDSVKTPDNNNNGNAYNNNYYNSNMILLPQSKNAKNFVKIFISIFLAIMLFTSGFLVAYLLVPSEEEKVARWIKNTSDKYFYDVDGSGVDFIGNIGNGMVNSMDQFSSFYYDNSLTRMKDENAGDYNDTGMILKQDKNGTEVRILKVYGNSPAYLKRLKVGDVIKKIKYNDVVLDVSAYTEAMVRETITQLKSQNINISYDFERKLGETNQTIAVNDLVSQEYNPVFSYYYDSQSLDSNNNLIMNGVDLDTDSAVITLEEFSTNADIHFANNLKTFKEKGKKNLILDLRTNFGGSLDILQNIASHLITDEANSDNVLIMNARFKDGSEFPYKTTNNYYNDYSFEKIIVLANEYSASATEVLINAMKDYGTINSLVGVKTYGKAVMQSYFELNKKYGMYMTVALLFSPVKNETYNTVGLVPDETVAYNPAGEFRFDNQLAKAVSLLNINSI